MLKAIESEVIIVIINIALHLLGAIVSLI